MNSNKLDFVRRQLSARVHGNVPIRVRLRTYLEFSRRIDTGLSELVDRWGHTAGGQDWRRMLRQK